MKASEATFNVELLQEFATVYQEEQLIEFVRGRAHPSFEDMQYPTDLKNPATMKRLLVEHCRKIDTVSILADLEEKDDESTSSEDDENNPYWIPPEKQLSLLACILMGDNYMSEDSVGGKNLND